MFYTPSLKTDRVLSALPRVKLPKNTVDEQNSVSRVSDEGINQDVFYSSASNDQEQAVPEQQSIPQQNEPSEEMYSGLFQSPKVAEMLSGRPKPIDSSQGSTLEVAKQTPMQGSNSTPGGDLQSFNVRPTAKAENESPKTQKSSDPPSPSRNSSNEDIQRLAADIASDTPQVSSDADRVSITSTATDRH